MFYLNTKEFLDNVCSNIKYKPARKQIVEELKIHIDEVKEEKISEGYSAKEAEELAVNQMEILFMVYGHLQQFRQL